MKKTVSLIALLLLPLCAMRAAEPDTQAASPARFVWGAEIGSSIDMSGNDMSSIDIDASFGLSRSWLRMLGVGTGAHIMVSNSCRTFPIYAVFRTDFSPRPRLLFLDLRGGMALNYLDYNRRINGAYAQIGMGLRLATGRTFSSHLIFGYKYAQRGEYEYSDGAAPATVHTIRYDDMHYAFVRLGVSF